MNGGHMRYKAILFDNDDTLMDFQAGNRIAVNQLMDELGYFHPDRYEQYQAVNHACWAALERGEIAQSEVRLRRFTRLYDLYPIPGNPAEASERFVTLLGEQSILLPHAEEVVRAIAAHLPIVIVTNGMTVIQKSRLARSPLKDLISGMVISEELGDVQAPARHFLQGAPAPGRFPRRRPDDRRRGQQRHPRG